MLDGMLTWPQALLTAVQFAGASGFGGMLVIILAGAVTAQEYSWRTLQLWLSRGAGRGTLLGAKFAALLLPIALFVLVPVVIVAPLTALFTVQIRGSLDAGTVNFGLVLLAMLRAGYTLLPYAALAFMLAVVTRSTVAAIGAGLGYSLLVEGMLLQIMTLFSGVAGELWKYLPAGLVNGLLAANSTGEALGKSALQPLDPVASAIGLGVYTLAFLGIALVAFRRQDLTG